MTRYIKQHITTRYYYFKYIYIPLQIKTHHIKIYVDKREKNDKITTPERLNIRVYSILATKEREHSNRHIYQRWLYPK